MFQFLNYKLGNPKKDLHKKMSECLEKMNNISANGMIIMTFLE